MASRLPLINSRAPLVLALALAAGGAGAAELGELRVGSYIGQPLVADIELVLIDAPSAAVQARLANPEVYRGANIGMPAVLSTLAMTVTQREGKQFLRMTSTAPVESGRLHVYLELLDGGGRNVRLATLSLAPNPNPPPPPPPPVPAPPLPVRAPIVAEALAPVAIVPLPATKPVPAPRPAPPPKPVVVAKAELPPEPVLAKPAPERKVVPIAKPVAQAVTGQEAEPEVKPAPKREAELEAKPAPTPEVTAAPVPMSSAALDYKSAQLREQISVLEDKVRVLQVAMGANPADVSSDQPAGHARPHPPRKRPAPEPESAHTPWGWIGGGLAAMLALAGGLFVVLRRRKTAGRIQPMPGGPVMARLRQQLARLKPRKKVAQSPEPQSDESAPEAVAQD